LRFETTYVAHAFWSAQADHAVVRDFNYACRVDIHVDITSCKTQFTGAFQEAAF